MSDKNVDLTGTKLAECVAKVIPIVNHLYDTRTKVTYQKLAELIGLPGVYGYRHQIGRVLYAARALDNFSDKPELRFDRMSVVITNASGKPGSGAHRLPKIVIEEVANTDEGPPPSAPSGSGSS
jgi:hypothetical protein